MRKFILIVIIVSLLASCSGSDSNSEGTEPATTETQSPHSTSTSESLTQTPVSITTSTPQPVPSPATYGPDEFPQGFNPLTGQRVADTSQLDIPALLVSISHFPPVARPQAGFSFAPFVYEYFITEGATRHLAVFHGEFPEPEIPLHGECKIRSEPITQTEIIFGNRVWHDEDQDGVQDPGEGGIGGICVNLYDANNNQVQQTTTDSNGYYAFNVPTGQYTLEFEKPSWLEFTGKNAGDEKEDSDVDAATGRTEAVDVISSLLYWDAGLISSTSIIPTPDPSVTLPAAQVGPVRSGRLVYRYIGNFYQNSCLIYASADPDVLSQIPGCATVPHTDAGGGAMLALTRMQEIARQISGNFRKFNYTGNLFSEEAPEGGAPAVELREFWANLNQSKWTYDAASEAWWRYVDESDPAKVGIFQPAVDRLNNRQLMFDNIVLVFAEHIVVEPTIVDINLQPGEIGKAYLFRDGQVYNIRWSTRTGEYEQETGLSRPMQFINLDGSPAALKPGHTWVIIFTTQSYLEDLSNGLWRARFIAPEGAK
jgi:hypothetical protein